MTRILRYFLKYLMGMTIFIIGVVVALYLIWHSVFYTQTWRYRMTVVVETPEGEKTGSAVREVTVKHGIHLFPEMMPLVLLKGEAVAVDLGKEGVLFALLSGAVHGNDYGSDIIFNALPKGKHTKTGLDRIPPKGKTVVLTPDQYPVFVRFQDLNTPNSVQNATIAEVSKYYDLKYYFNGTVFGEGVTLKEVRLEMTDDPVTWTIDQWIKWLPERKKEPYIATILLGPRDKPVMKLELTVREFSKGRYW